MEEQAKKPKNLGKWVVQEKQPGGWVDVASVTIDCRDAGIKALAELKKTGTYRVARYYEVDVKVEQVQTVKVSAK